MLRKISLLLMLMFGLTMWVNAQTPIDPIVRVDAPAVALHLNDPLLLTGGSRSVAIFDISDSANPQKLSEFDVSDSVNSLTTSGNLAIIGLDATDEQEPNLIIVDITDPTTPQVLFERHAGTGDQQIQAVHAVGDIVYAGFANSGISAIQVSEKDEPIIVGGIDTDDIVSDMISVGHRLYVATWTSITVLNISNPESITLINRVESLNDFNNGLDIDGDILGVAEGFWGLSFYDISDPDKPVLLPNSTVRLFNAHEMFKISLRQKFAYVAVFAKRSTSVFDPRVPGGMKVIDFEQLSNPSVILDGKVEGENHAFDVIAYNGYVYVAEDNKLAVYEHGPKGEIRPTSTPILPTSTPTPTITPTPTKTPPLLATATKQPGTPVPQPTATNTATPTKSSIPTPTLPPQPIDTPTPVAGPVQPDAVFEFGEASLNANGWAELEGGFSGATPGTTISLDFTEKQFPTSKDMQGLFVILRQDELTFLLTNNPINTGGHPALIRAKVRASGPGASLFIGALKGSLFTQQNFDGSLAYSQNVSSAQYVEQEDYIMALLKPDTGDTINPFIQLVGGKESTTNVWIDRVEVFVMKPGTPFPE